MLDRHPALRPLLNRLALQIHGQELTPKMLTDLSFCDRFLLDQEAHRSLDDAVRVELYTALLSPGPGGLTAFAWLVRRGHANSDLIMDYLACQKPGPPVPTALDEEKATAVFEALLGTVPMTEAQLLTSVTRLLASQSLAAAARTGLFRRLLSGAFVLPEVRRQLVVWSTGGLLGSVPLPPAPPEVFRAGTMARVEGGEGPELVLRQVLSFVDQRESPDAVSEATLDLVDLFGEKVERSLRLQALDMCRQQPDSKIRRRAYQLAERTEGESFLRLGLRDQDFGVRSWVLARVTRKRTTA